jgi:acetyl-CoA carboxylase carboxyltransferase component
VAIPVSRSLHSAAAILQEPYDMRDVLAEVVDDRYVFEMIPDYARNVISGFARLGGETVGIIANNPLVLAGVLDMDAAIKASRCAECVWSLVFGSRSLQDFDLK